MALREDLLPLWDIYEEHLDEAAFLWARRERCLISPLFNLEDTGQEEARLMAHLEELAEGGRQVDERLVEPVLEEDDPERTSAAVYALLLSQGDAAYPRVLEALESGDEARHAAIQKALELWEGPERAARLKPLWSSSIPALGTLALEVAAFHGEAPEAMVLVRTLGGGDLQTRIAAMSCARWLPDPLRSSCASAALQAPEPSMRLAGIELGLQCGLRKAWEACHALAAEPSAWSVGAWVLLASCGGVKDLEPILRGLDDATWRPYALWALGFSGRVAAADACVEAMKAHPATIANIAAEAFSAITGLRIQGRYAGPPPPEEEPLPPLEEEDLDANLIPQPEKDLPVPAVEALAQWWQHARGQLDPAGRYLRGQPFSGPMLLQALEQEPMRRRHILALELAIRSRGNLQLQTRGRVARQYRTLKAAASQARSIPMKLFER